MQAFLGVSNLDWFGLDWFGQFTIVQPVSVTHAVADAFLQRMRDEFWDTQPAYGGNKGVHSLHPSNHSCLGCIAMHTCITQQT
jgi:hypothetical protein